MTDFFDLANEINQQIQNTRPILNRINPNKSMPEHVINCQQLKTKKKKKPLNAARKYALLIEE